MTAVGLRERRPAATSTSASGITTNATSRGHWPGIQTNRVGASPYALIIQTSVTSATSE